MRGSISLRAILVLSVAAALALCFTNPAQAATLTWDAGGSATDLNWSNSENWDPDGSPGGNVILFDDTGGAASGTTSIVDQSFTISSLTFTNLTTRQTPDIASPTTTLTVSGGLTFGSTAISSNVSNYFTGSGALVVSGGSFNLGVGTSGTGNYTQTVDMSGLSTFTFSNSGGSFNVGASSAGSRATGGDLRLALNSSITASTVNVGSSGNNGPTSYLRLSAGTNVINAGNISIATGKVSGNLLFASTADSTSTVTIRGKTGGTSRVVTFMVGQRTCSSGSGQQGVVDFSLGSVDARIDTLVLGASDYNQSNNPSNPTGTFILGPDPNSVVDVNTVTIARGHSRARGTLDIRGGTFRFGTIGAAVGTANIYFKGGTIASNTTGGSTMTPAFRLGLAGTTAEVAFGETSAPTRSLTFDGGVTLDGDTMLTVNVPTTFAGVVSGNGGAAYGLTKGGDGTLVLAAANTYTGSTTVDAGTLTLGSTGSLLMDINDAPGGSTQLLGAGTLNLDGRLNLDVAGVTGLGTWDLVDVANLTSVAYGGTFAIGMNGGAAFANNAGVWSYPTMVGEWIFTPSTGVLAYTIIPTIAWVGGQDGNNWAVPANWSGNPDPVPGASGAWVSFGDPGSSGTADLAGANRTVGRIIFNAGVDTTITDAANTGNKLVLDYGGNLVTVTVVGGTHGITSGVELKDNADFAVNGGQLTLDGAITEDPASSGRTLTKTGDGTLVLNGENTYTGGTTAGYGTARKGVLVVGNGSALGSGTITMMGAEIQAGAPGITLDNAVSVSGGGFRFSGSNDLTFTGTTTLQGGNRGIGNYTSGSTLTLGAIDTAGYGVTFEGLGGAANGTTIVNGTISGDGGVTVNASYANGTVVLAGDNTYTGATTINGGTLVLSGDNSSVTGTTTINAGTLALAGGDNRLPSTATVSFDGADGSTATLDIGGTSQTLSTITFPCSQLQAAVKSTLTVNITGSGGTLTVNGASDLRLGPNASNANNTNPATIIDMADLTNFIYDASGNSFSVQPGGSNIRYEPGVPATSVTLAANNTITAANLNVGQQGGSAGGGICILNLGATNAMNVDNINVGAAGRSNATLRFATGLTSPSLVVRDTDGSSPATSWKVGTIAENDSSTWTDTVDFTAGSGGSAGTLDALVTTLVIGVSDIGTQTGRQGTVNAFFTVGATTGQNLTVTNLNVGQIANSGGGTLGGAFTSRGTFTLDSASGIVNAGTISLAANTMTDSTTRARTVSGTFNLTDGTLNATTVRKGDQTGWPTATVNLAFNWANGTIGNIAGGDLTFTKVPITLSAGTHTFNISDSNTATLDADSPITGPSGITKTGDGTLVLAGANTYTGDTAVSEGTLTLADDAQLTFVIGDNGESNKITGDGTVDLFGDFNFDLTGAGQTIGDQWTIVTVGTLAETYMSTFSVLGFTDAGGDKWTKAIDASKNYEFTESTGLLKVVAGIVPGDTNDDKVVDAADFITLKKNFGTPGGAGVSQGNFTGDDGAVNWDDLSILTTNFSVGGTGAPSMTPEPATLGLLALGALAVLRRRRK